MFCPDLARPSCVARIAGPKFPLWRAKQKYADLSRRHPEELRGDLIGRLGLGLMKAVAEDRLLPWLTARWAIIGRALARWRRRTYSRNAASLLDGSAFEEGQAAETRERVMS